MHLLFLLLHVVFTPPTTADDVLGILLNNRQFALELHRRCNPDDLAASHPLPPTTTTTKVKPTETPPPAWRLLWQVDSISFPCLDNTAPGIECSAIHDDTVGREGWWWQITSIVLPSVGLRCHPEIMINKYELKHLHTLDLSGYNNHIDIDTFRAFILPSIPNVEYLNVGNSILPQEATNNASRTLTSALGPDTFRFCDLIALKHIDLTNAYVDGPLFNPDCVGNFVDLHTLMLKGNDFNSCSPDLVNLPIERIDVSNNDRLIFTSNNESANHCFSSKVLKHVAFQNNKQASGFIGNDICNAHQQLEWLDLSGSTFVSGLPPCFDKMTNLKYLDLSSTSTLPDTWLKGLVSIERIEWGNNVHHVTNKGSSKTFSSEWNKDVFPNGTGMTSLQYLNLSHNGQGKSFGNMDAVLLPRIVTANNSSSSSTNSSFASIFPNVRVLDLTGCRLNGALTSTAPLANLKELYLGSNKLSSNLKSILQFGGVLLEVLDVRHNQLSDELSIGMFDAFQFIQVLLLSNNQLKSQHIPLTYFYSLKHLKVLDLSNNALLQGTLPFQTLPSSLNLEKIDLRGTTILGLNGVTLKTMYSDLLRLDQTVFEVDGDKEDINVTDTAAVATKQTDTVVACFPIRFKGTNALLYVDPLDTNYLQCLCLGGGGAPPLCLNCPRNAKCDLLGMATPTCYAGYWYNSALNECIQCGSNVTSTVQLKTTVEMTTSKSSGMRCNRDGTTSATIEINPGYWRIEDRNREDPMSYQNCLTPSACTGGKNSSCSKEYDGLLCNECFNGGSIELQNVGPHRYYLNTYGRCSECQTQGGWNYMVWVVSFVVVVGIGVLFALYVLFTDTYHYNRLGEWKFRQRYGHWFFSYFTNPTTLHFVAHLSTVATVTTTYGATVEFPQETKNILGYLSLIFDGNVVGLDAVACRFSGNNNWPMEPHFRVVFLCMFPIIVGIVLLLIYLSSVIVMWRLWVLHVEYYDENITKCCRLREREFPENIVLLIKRRLVTFYTFLMCLYYPAFMTNGFRGSIIPCHFVAGSKDFVIDPLAFHPAINKYYRFSCTAKGREADAYMLTLYMSIVLLVLHCFLLPVIGVAWLCCNRHHIVSYHSSHDLGEGRLVALPSVHVKPTPGTILSFKFLFEHFNQGSKVLRIFGFCGELLIRSLVALVTIFFDQDHWGLVYASFLVLLHMIFVAVVRPYDRKDVYTSSSLSDTCTIVVLLSVSLYTDGFMNATQIDVVFYYTTMTCVALSLVLHCWRLMTVVKQGKARAKDGVGGKWNHGGHGRPGSVDMYAKRQRDTGSAWGRRYNKGGGVGNLEKETTPVVSFSEEHEEDGQGMLFDESDRHYPMTSVSPPTLKNQSSQRNPLNHAVKKIKRSNNSSMSRTEKDIRFKLQAWYYRYSFVQRWHDTFRREHHKIPSRVDQAKDPDLIRNQSRLDVRTQELHGLGVVDLASAFRERNLKPKQDNRLIMVPKDTTNDGLTMITTEKNYLSEKMNHGLNRSIAPEDLKSYDNVLVGVEPGSSKHHNGGRNQGGRRGGEGNKTKKQIPDGFIRTTALPRRSMYTLFSQEQKNEAPPRLEPS